MRRAQNISPILVARGSRCKINLKRVDNTDGFEIPRVAHAHILAGQSPRCSEAAVRLCRSDTAGTRCDSIFSRKKKCVGLSRTHAIAFSRENTAAITRVHYHVLAITVGVRTMGQSSSNIGHSGECQFYVRIRNCVLLADPTFFRVALHGWHVSTARALDFTASSCASFVDFFGGIASFARRTFPDEACVSRRNNSGVVLFLVYVDHVSFRGYVVFYKTIRCDRADGSRFVYMLHLDNAWLSSVLQRRYYISLPRSSYFGHHRLPI